MSIEIISYQVYVGPNIEVARRQPCLNFADAISRCEQARNPGEIWACPVTQYGFGKLKLVGRYDGSGGVFMGREGDEPATPDALFSFTTLFN